VLAEEIELELIEEYELMGEKRFRFQVKGANIVINVAAENVEEARKKALELARDVGVDVVLRILKG
jgi:hypothetical protein